MSNVKMKLLFIVKTNIGQCNFVPDPFYAPKAVKCEL